ncbi:His-Xaa-Ser system radical SAM maturase HxsB [Clostridium sp. PL3]|uniref:His-Xaa-Ser system radical SAM maturase HxsB n=1 Tax=Clostridium thailandense TaxID=2794346 RepID=A0A949U2E3_9CLOT|nr:His-Xaa-Ser system radical SAM maturase HxsB [Clostridium thailandense]MBV7276160.1 His-Xaa-Ser system radical SAM maturase HxsB [Clostridium thailandense]
MNSNLNYFNFKKFKDKYLLTNDLGNFIFLSEDEFPKVYMENYEEGDELYKKLAKEYFIVDGNKDSFVDNASELLKRHKTCLFDGTQLHIFVLTTNCNQSCVYCQATASLGNNLNKMMNKETAKRAVDIAMQSSSQSLSFEFQGGEPLLNFETIRYILEYSLEKNKKINKEIGFNLVSNLILMNDDMIEFFIDNNVNIATSIDGDEYVHDKNRPYGTTSSFKIVKEKIDKINKLYKERGKDLKVQAIQTTTRFSLNRWKEIIDTYVQLGMDTLFIRPLTPLGNSKDRWNEIGYTPEEFLDFYKKCCNYIKELNSKGEAIKEGHYTIFLSKILKTEYINYMELRSPCGGTIGQMAYNYDGNIFTCDEGRMLAERGDDSFKLGNVYKDDFSLLVNSRTCNALCIASCLEALPGCCDCVYSPYCGVCPVYNYDKTGSLFDQMPGNYKCRIYKGMLDIIFEDLL